MSLDAPFPWFGGKRRVAPEVWARFGDLKNYVEPFFGSGAVLLGRPQPFAGVETINDLDGLVANFWRAIQRAPHLVAKHADHPVNENDLHARHAWLVHHKRALQERLEGDPSYYSPTIAGWWVWGVSCWIGSGFCSGKGPWRVVNRQLVHLGHAGQGVNRKLVRLDPLGAVGVCGSRRTTRLEWFEALAERLRHVRVSSGDWSRVCTPAVTFRSREPGRGTLCGVFLDPPYGTGAERDPNLYNHDSLSVAHDVRHWAIANGRNPRLRIALCGYEGEHEMPRGWTVHAWQAHGGMGCQAKAGRDGTGNYKRERIWFSPHCLPAEQAARKQRAA